MAWIHIEVDDELHRQVDVAAAMNGVTARQFLVEALEAAIAIRRRSIQAVDRS